MRLPLLLLGLVLTAGSASAEPAVTDVCQVTDQRLEELSGLASDGSSWFAVNDSDTGRVQVQVLGRDCAVRRTITAPANPFDVEDLALAPDGTLWLADIGDNGKSRTTVALHAVSPGGASRLYRLTYPDGNHDAEALLLGADGTPYVVTKETLGSALVYRPVGALDDAAPTALEQVAQVSIHSTGTPGGPLENRVVTRLVTGGAVSKDGKVVALRTYTDAYLFPAPDGDVVKALSGDPVRVPLPNEPQGEAIAFEPDGTLLSASEFGKDGTPSVVRAVQGAAALALPAAPTTSASPQSSGEAAPAPAPAEETSLWPVVGGGLVVLALVAASARRARRRR